MAILAAAWLWVAWAFHLQRYATINWAARWFALAFAVEALLLVWIGLSRHGPRFDRASGRMRAAGLAVAVLGIFVQPLLAPLAGRSWMVAEVFGIHGDPTAIATLGILLAGERIRWPLLAIPVAWCAVSGATSWAMEWPDAVAVPAVAAGAVAFAVWNAVATPPRRSGRVER